MSEIFLFYKFTIMSGLNMLYYLHLLFELISSKEYWRVTKNLVPVLERVIQVKF